MTDLTASLNPMQRAAVELPAEHGLILAGAGSGKTRVLTTRIAWLIANGFAYPSQILAVTFTNKAAREMRTRLESMLSVDVSRMWVGTFHGIAHKLLRLHAVEAGLPKTFQIIDSSDQLSLIKRIMKEAGIDTEQNDPRKFQSMVNDFKEKGMRAAAVTISDTNQSGMGVYRAYENRCQREGLVDFAELLLRSVELLENNALLREHYAERFRFILVDEFQDTNVLQFRWIKALAHPTKGTNCVFCVGDDDQSIYAFRGARVGNMADFIRDYGVKHIVKLEQNYRSTSHILDAANAVIANNENRMGKNLWTDSGAGEPITVYEALDDRDEARTITQDIMSRHRSGTPWSHCAVLYRNNAQSRIIEQYFTANGVPYKIYGGLRFFDRQEVKDVTAYLRVMNNPDDTSLLRVINHPPRGIGATSVGRLQQAAQARGLSLWDTLGAWQDDPSVIKRIAPFIDLIEALKDECAGLNLPDTINRLMEKTGLKAYYEAQKDKDIRLENLAEIVTAAEGFYRENDIDDDAPAFERIEGGDMSPVDGFLAQATLEADDKNEAEVQEAVQMMTVHASKGLEFPHVYLCGVEEGLFPHSARPGEDEAKALAEERRLMYVAMTRAQRRLRISWCAQRMLYGETRSNLGSSFLDEIPSEHVVVQESALKREAGATQSYSRRGSGEWGGGYGRSSGGYGNYGGNSGSYGAGARSSGYASRSSDYGERTYGQTRSGGWRSGQVGRASDYLNEKQSMNAVPSVKSKAAENRWGLQVGDKVQHAKFGVGVVERLVNVQDEANAQVRVKFGIGVKELLLQYAKLTKV
ncbi:MAG: UvrD-helicase domain-containing protein [Duodenibacillus sp.]|nr:UvrD-helicase domain-containing protein [Duodenibacillus sp.]